MMIMEGVVADRKWANCRDYLVDSDLLTATLTSALRRSMEPYQRQSQKPLKASDQGHYLSLTGIFENRIRWTSSPG